MIKLSVKVLWERHEPNHYHIFSREKQNLNPGAGLKKKVQQVGACAYKKR